MLKKVKENIHRQTHKYQRSTCIWSNELASFCSVSCCWVVSSLSSICLNCEVRVKSCVSFSSSSDSSTATCFFTKSTCSTAILPVFDMICTCYRLQIYMYENPNLISKFEFIYISISNKLTISQNRQSENANYSEIQI